MSTSRAKLKNKELDEPTIVKGVEAGKYAWIDLTESDMQQYGQECENFARKYTGGAEKTLQDNPKQQRLLGSMPLVLVLPRVLRMTFGCKHTRALCAHRAKLFSSRFPDGFTS